MGDMCGGDVQRGVTGGFEEGEFGLVPSAGVVAGEDGADQGDGPLGREVLQLVCPGGGRVVAAPGHSVNSVASTDASSCPA